MIKAFQFLASPRLRFQSGCLQALGEEVKSLGGKKIFLVTDRGVKSSGLLDRAIQSLEKEKISYTAFDEVEPNPSIQTIEKGFIRFKENGCDFLVGLGGGSPMDTAKAIGVQVTNPGPLLNYEGLDKVVNPIPPLIAIPTTAGTGSEVTAASVFTDRARKFKTFLRSTYIVPKVALLDPQLLLTLPPPILASTGMDAFTHAYESFVSTNTNPVSQALAIDAIRLISQNLRRFYAYPENLEAAEAMMIASTMAGLAFASGRTGIVHGMAHPLGGHYDVPHGVANAILLPHCMEFTRMGVPELFRRIAEAMGEDIRGLSIDGASKKAVEAVRNLLSDIGIPKNLREAGAGKEGIEVMGQEAIQSKLQLNTPRKINLEDVKVLYEKAFA
jgi:alcohol dehydrogenase class IV